MTVKEIIEQLEQIASSTDFAGQSAILADRWTSDGTGVEAVEPILRFMEEHAAIEFGTPGALVHFVERFYGNGYEGKLLESVKRRPTLSTIWMLNRVINGTKSPEIQQLLIGALEQSSLNPLTDQNTRQLVSRFLNKLQQ